MCFTPKIYSPSKTANVCTEIQLKDRLLTNNDLTEFFINIPKRIDTIEIASDVSDNLDAFALANDVTKNKDDISEIKDDIKTINDAVEELEYVMGEKLISGTVQYNLNEVWNTLFGTENLIDFITDVNDDLCNTKNIDLVNMQKEIDSNTSSSKTNTDAIKDHAKRLLDVENKSAQIDVNTAYFKVVEAKIEQVRTEFNNVIDELWKAVNVLRDLNDISY